MFEPTFRYSVLGLLVALAWATPAQAQNNPLVEKDLSAERKANTYSTENDVDCPFSTEWNADGSRNWNSRSTDLGALHNNAEYALQQEPGYPYGQVVGFYDVQLQRYGDQCFVDGILKAQDYGLDGIDPETGKTPREHIERGLLINEWALDRQEPDGSWTAQASWGQPQDSAGRTEDLMRETSFFVAHASRGLHLLQNSGYAAPFQTEINDQKAKLKKAMVWQADKPNLSAARASASDMAHRYFLRGFAFSITARLVGSSDPQYLKLKDRAAEEVDAALKRQIGSPALPSPYASDHGAWREQTRPETNPDGTSRVNPDGTLALSAYPGTDTGYHATSQRYAQWFWHYTPTYGQLSELKIKIDNGWRWINTRTTTDGWLTIARNTRTCIGYESGVKPDKYPSPTSNVHAAAVWSVINPASAWTNGLATRVEDYNTWRQTLESNPNFCAYRAA